jgi:hypothetical protein
MDIVYISYQAIFVVNQYYSTVVMNLHLSAAIYSSRMSGISSNASFELNRQSLDHSIVPAYN